MVVHLAAAATVCWTLGHYTWDKEIGLLNNRARAKEGKSTTGCYTLEKRGKRPSTNVKSNNYDLDSSMDGRLLSSSPLQLLTCRPYDISMTYM